MTLLQLDYTATAQDSVAQLARRRGRGVHIRTSAFAPLLRWDRLIATPEKAAMPCLRLARFFIETKVAGILSG